MDEQSLRRGCKHFQDALTRNIKIQNLIYKPTFRTPEVSGVGWNKMCKLVEVNSRVDLVDGKTNDVPFVGVDIPLILISNVPKGRR